MSAMTSPTTREPPKRRSVIHQTTVEEQALNMMAQEAESRLNTSQAVLAEARNIRSRELERIRRETGGDDDNDEGETSTVRTPPVLTKSVSVASDNSRIVGNDELGHDSMPLKAQLVELENKYKKVMMTNAQMHNEKLAGQYEFDRLKDLVSDLEEQEAELRRLLRIQARDMEQKKLDVKDAMAKCEQLRECVLQRDELIKKHGLVLVETDECDMNANEGQGQTALLSADSADILNQYEGKSLGERLKRLYEEKTTLSEENKRLHHELEIERSRFALTQRYQSVDASGNNACGTPTSGDAPVLDVETQKNVTELKFKLKRAEQEITTLQGSVTRLESQANRYKLAAESSELSGEQLKQEKKTLKNELREAQKQLEEVTTQNTHLTRRLERAKVAKNLGETN